MSFPKAKLKRFNDINSCTPSPADYNVKTKQHVAGSITSKSERFLESCSPALSEHSSVTSYRSIPSFRTPNLPRKLKQFQKVKTADVFLKLDDMEHLKEKIVEIHNKDQYIRELTEQIEELKCKLKSTDNCNVTVEHEYEVIQLKEKYEQSLLNLQIQHKKAIDDIRYQVKGIVEQTGELHSCYQVLSGQAGSHFQELLQQIEHFEVEHYKLTERFEAHMATINETLQSKEQELSELKQTHLDLQKQLDEFKTNQLEELHDVQFGMLESMELMKQDLENEIKLLKISKEKELATLQEQLTEEKETLIKDFEAKIEQIEENHKEALLLTEIQLKETLTEVETSWKMKLSKQEEEAQAILKECQAISEYTIIQSELEKNRIKNELIEAEKDCEQLQVSKRELAKENKGLNEKNKNLQKQMSAIIVELNTVRTTVDTEINKYKALIQQASIDKRAYEITIAKTHEAIDALKNRLLNSDRSVEQLKAELEATETSKMEFEGKCSYLLEELQVLYTICEEYETQHKQKITERVQSVEQSLLRKIDDLKEEANKKIEELQSELTATKDLLQETSSQCHKGQTLIDEANNLISQANDEIEIYEKQCEADKCKIEYLEKECQTLRNKVKNCKETDRILVEENKKLFSMLDNAESEIESSRSKEVKYMEQITVLNNRVAEYAKKETAVVDLNDYKCLLKKLQDLEIENVSLKTTISEQESLIGPFRAQLEDYEMEHRALMSKAEDAEKEAREIGLKYAEMLGHQNIKQKIKYLRDLKQKNYELVAGKKELENKVVAQNKIIEKLKMQVATSKSPKKNKQLENKENLNSPNKTLNSSRMDSPLKERN